MNDFESGVDLESFGQKSRSHVAHQVPGDVEMLEALVAAQSVYHVVDLSSKFAVGEVQLLDRWLFVLKL